jgi:para-aminobenzoate synthetase component I
MEIIGEIEKQPRQVYCGSIGYLGFDGNLDLNVAIRTVALRDGRASFQAGGGVTLMSEPEAEYHETLVKAEKLFRAFVASGRASGEPAIVRSVGT